MLSKGRCSSKNNSSITEAAETSYRNPAILRTYEDKLYQQLTFPKHVSYHGSVERKYTKDSKKHMFKGGSLRASPSQKQHDPKSSSVKIREIKCLTCSFLTNVGLVERTEDIIDSLKDHCHRCGASLLVALPYKKKKYQSFSRQRHFSIANRSDIILNQCIGNASAFRLTHSPPYERKHTSSQAGAELSANTDAQAALQHTDLTKLTFLDCLKLSDPDAENRQHAASQRLSIGKDANSKNTIANPDCCCNYCCNYCKEPRSLSQRGYRSCHIHSTSAVQRSADEVWGNTSSRYCSPVNKDFVLSKMKSHSGKKPVRVHLLTGDSILLVFDPKAHVKEVFDQVCSMHSIKEHQFFGLSAVVDKEHRFMDLKQRLSKYAPKEWGKELKRRGSDLSIQPSSVFTVQFQVQYYVEHPKLICNHQSRQHYYLQLKRNVLQCKVPTQDETIITLAATALYLDMGPFDPIVHTSHYFDPNEYVPTWFIKKWNEEYLWSHLPTMHQELSSTSAFSAQADYIKLASTIEDVPVHYYKLFKTKTETNPSVVLGIFHQGIRIHHVAEKGLDGPHLLDFEFPWSKVGRLFFASKRFEIYPEDLPSSRKLIYFTGSRSRSKYLLRLLRDTHSLYTSLTPFVQHMRRVDGKNGTKRYRESYISGMNLEERLIGGVEERLIGLPDDVSPNSNSSKKDRKKLSEFYNSSTSRGSSHTSGIESDSKQRPEDADEEVDEQTEDNAFVDDFDPIEVDNPPRRGVIMVTQQHLNAPPHKNLSVNNLTEVFPSDARLALPKEADQETLSNSGTTHSHNTVYNEDTQRDVTVRAEGQVPDAPRNSTSSDSRQRASTSTDGVLLPTETNSLRMAHLKEGTSIYREADPDPKSKTPHRSGPLIPDLLDAFPDVPHHKASDSEADLTKTPVIRRPQAAFRVSDNELGVDHQRQGSQTFYDDTHTIQRQQRNQSVDIDWKCIFTHSTTGELKPFVCPIKDGKHQQRRHNSQAEPDSSQIQRSVSSDSLLRQQTERKGHSKSKTEAGSSQRHRNKWLHDAQGMAGDGNPDGKYFGGKLVHNKSVEDLTQTVRTLSRSERKKDIPQTFSPYVSTPSLEVSRQPVDATVSAPSSSRRNVAEHSTEPHVVHHRKMSDICHQTIAAQHQKMSDHHKHHHLHGHRRHSDLSSAKPAEPSRTVGHAVGAAGYTPKKTEVMLRAKREKTSHNRHRPVSYHVAKDGNFSHDRKRHSCFSDAIFNSNSPVYVESFKEVIV